MPIGAPPRQTATRNVGRKSLRRICTPSCIASRNKDSAEIKVLCMGLPGEGAHYSPSRVEREALAELAIDRTVRHESAQPAQQFGLPADRMTQPIRRLDGTNDLVGHHARIRSRLDARCDGSGDT